MEEYKILAGGEFIKSNTQLDVLNKFTGEKIAITWQADKEILNEAIRAATKAQKEYSQMSAFEKEEALLQVSVNLLKQKKELAILLARESAKPIQLATVEIERSANIFKIAAEECKRLPKEYISLDWTPLGKGKEGLISYFPAGIVAGISPFNFPMNLAVHKIAPAIAAGCPIILKPASSTPLSSLALAKIISETKLPKGAVSILPMNRETGNLLVTDARIQILSFTGSPAVGWELKKQSGKKKVILELGGNAAVIISERSKIKDIVPFCIQGAFAYSGQICIHAQRFIVHESIYADFVEEMKKETERLKNGDPLDLSTQFSHLIDEENAVRIENWVKESMNSGAKLISGGKRKGSFFEPTILLQTTSQMKVNCEEVFGPVICIDNYSGGIENAVEMLNDSEFGLQCGIFTDSVKELDYVYKNAAVGGVIHNNVPTLRFDHMPYGGIKESGMGREGVKYAIAEMMEAKILVK